MMGKLPLLLGLGVGYVLGSRGGRGHYDKLSEGVNKMWNDPRVQDKVEVAKAKAPVVASKLTDQAKSAGENVKSKIADKTGHGSDDLNTTTTGYGDTMGLGETDPAAAGVTSDSWAKTEDSWKKDSTGL